MLGVRGFWVFNGGTQETVDSSGEKYTGVVGVTEQGLLALVESPCKKHGWAREPAPESLRAIEK